MDQRIEAAKAALPVTVSTITLLGVPLNEWVFIVTLIYTCLMIVFLLRDKLLVPLLKKYRTGQINSQIAEPNDAD